MSKCLFLFLLYFSFALISGAQTFTISGKINEEGTDIGLPNATVQIKNSNSGTVTGPKGDFLLVLPAGIYELEISSVGFATFFKEIDVQTDQVLFLAMKEGMLALPEFVLETNTLSGGRQGIRSIPGSVQYLDAKQLQLQQYTNVNDVLKQIPGVNIQEEDGFGLRPNIGLRGSGSERSSKITLMEDGILAAPAPYSAPSAYYFPTMGRMSGVEILKGSSQVRFGPFTTGGAINFISTPIPTTGGGFIGLTAGSFGTTNIHAHIGDKKERFGYLVESFQYGAEGFKSVPNGATGFLKNDLNAKFSVNTSPESRNYQSLTFNVGRTKEDSDETYLGITEDDFKDDPYQRYAASQVDNMEAEQNRFSIQHYLELPGLFNMVTTAYRNNFHRNWYKLDKVNGASLADVLDDPSSFSDQYDLLTGATNTVTGDLIVKANNRSYTSQGIQTTFDVEFETGKVSHDIHISTRFHEDKEDRFQHKDGYAIEDRAMKLIDKGAPGSDANRIEHADAISSYLFYKINVGKFSFTPGIRHELVTVRRDDYGTSDQLRTGANLISRSNDFSAWLPGLGINYAMNAQSSIFGGVHKGFAPGGSLEGAESESSINYEVGARRTARSFSTSAVLFLNDYNNLLGADNASAGGTGSGDMFNAGEALTKGLEFQMTYDFLPNAKTYSLPVSVAYTYTSSRFGNSFDSGFEEWGSVSDGDEIPYLAKNQLYASVGFQTANYNLTINGRYQSQIRTTPGSGDIQKLDRIDAFFTSDVSMNYFIDSRTTFFGSVTNIADTEYAVARRPAGLRPGMPRAFRLGVSVRF